MLKSKKYLLLLLIFLATPAFAADTPPSEESIKRLLVVTNAKKIADDMMSQMDGGMRNAIKQALQGKTVTPDQQKVFDNMQNKIDDLLKQELNWESLEPLYIQIYRESFTQEEISGILAFYETPVGQALIKKMPIVMQKSMEDMQKRMGTLLPKLQKIQQETLAQLKEHSEKSGKK
jgi:hypothetical protein